MFTCVCEYVFYLHSQPLYVLFLNHRLPVTAEKCGKLTGFKLCCSATDVVKADLID